MDSSRECLVALSDLSENKKESRGEKDDLNRQVICCRDGENVDLCENIKESRGDKDDLNRQVICVGAVKISAEFVVGPSSSKGIENGVVLKVFAHNSLTIEKVR
ncbi:hypothetical protein AVEN_201944-1 [Araneus ventricosus]|uniref:Uncharacterized protein n=1 Tax=Araneus ventricosus TaxID=182803 RepID=A0A4Y2L2W9_ARAVE|nr:hypothetical protein AVEN_239330-1 [Araneus ventricosus]GBN08887.1 hypothetical protein AVEN_28553-1 [Araneus ventricosus]GBN08918.1 hypothetical protein AVEN_143106-1 [Araneus ventricosus]GBN08948.1 hypothetical protein AVEN_201944-1 [Araneus ventricosus]